MTNLRSAVIVRESRRSSNRRTAVKGTAYGIDRFFTRYWMPAFAGMTAEIAHTFANLANSFTTRS
jgi:hypothetical protein